MASLDDIRESLPFFDAVEAGITLLDERLNFLWGNRYFKQELANLPRLSTQYRRLRRDRDADEEQYRTYKRRLRDARHSGEMDRQKIASINVIQPGTPSARPIWPPSKPASASLALVLAAIAGGLAAVATDRFGPTGIVWLDGKPGEREAK